MKEPANQGCLTNQLVKEMGLRENIIEQYQQRDVIVTNCNWGQMRIISCIIDRCARSEVGTDEWENVVCAENRKNRAIVSASFGNNESSCNGAWSFFLKGLCVILFAFVMNFLITSGKIEREL